MQSIQLATITFNFDWVVRYRSINTESAAFKSKLTNLVGPLNLLVAVGFEKQEDGKLKYPDRFVQFSLFDS